MKVPRRAELSWGTSISELKLSWQCWQYACQKIANFKLIFSPSMYYQKFLSKKGIFFFNLVFNFQLVLDLLGCFRLEGKTEFNFRCRQKKIREYQSQKLIKRELNKSLCKEICTFAQRLASDLLCQLLRNWQRFHLVMI